MTINQTNEYNSFVLRGSFENSDESPVIFNVAADTLLNDVNTDGEVTVAVSVDVDPPSYATTNDGVEDILLDGSIFCFAEGLNGQYVYFTVRGGLPVGDYIAVIQLRKKNGDGQWDPLLSTSTIEFTINKQFIALP